MMVASLSADYLGIPPVGRFAILLTGIVLMRTAVATVTWRFVERPMLAFGNTLLKRFSIAGGIRADVKNTEPVS